MSVNHQTQPDRSILEDKSQDMIKPRNNYAAEDASASPSSYEKKNTNKKMNIKRMGTILKDFQKDEDDEIEVKGNTTTCPRLIDTRMRYFTILVIITLVSIISFIFFATVAYFHRMYDAFGVGILFSRGAALAIIVLTMLAMFLVTYDLTSWCQSKLKRR